jgi:hypothetical protein
MRGRISYNWKNYRIGYIEKPEKYAEFDGMMIVYLLNIEVLKLIQIYLWFVVAKNPISDSK